MITGVVHDKLYLPGLLKLKRLIDSGFFGRILSVRGEFGYWVFEGDLIPAQRPSWNYRAEDGGGMVLDMFRTGTTCWRTCSAGCEAVTAKAVTHIPERWDEQGRSYAATADDAAYAIFELDGDIIAQINSSWAVRVDRGELVEFQVDGTHGSAVAGLFGCRIQPRAQTPKPVWNPDLPTDRGLPLASGSRSRTLAEFTNGFRAQWEQFLSDVDAGRAARLRPRRRRAWPAAGRGRPAVLGRGPPGRDRRGSQLDDRDHRDSPCAARKPTAAGASRARRHRGPGPNTRRRYSSRIAFAAAHVVADPHGENVPGAPAVDRLGRHPGVPAAPVPLRARRGRGDGHRPAQHGAGLGRDPGADHPQRRPGAASSAPGSRPAPARTSCRPQPATLERGDRRLHSSRSSSSRAPARR